MSHWTLCCLVSCSLVAAAQGYIRVGAALNIFKNFGDLGSVIKIKGHGDNSWFTDRDFVDVFQQILETRSPLVPPEDDNFNGDFLLQLCDNAPQLKAALVLGHRVEGLEMPRTAYTGGWSNNAAAAHLGINATYLTGSHGYALVRLNRHHQLVALDPDYELHLNQWAAEGTKNIVPEKTEDVFDFVQVFGSHYISSYLTGDSLYQVFVFAPTVYENLRKAMREYEETGHGREQVLEFFTPWHVEHVGRIVSLSGNTSVEEWAEQNLRSRMLVFYYSSLLNLLSAPDLLQVVNFLLGNEAILSADLRSLAPYLSNETQRTWFTEVLDNHMKLWELSV